MAKLKLLISTYACEPGKGSEPAVGWNWAEQMSLRHDTWVITRANNKPSIEGCAEDWVSQVNWIFYDLPAWTRWWKKRGRGVQLYYFLWQIGAYFRIRKLRKVVPFDVVHHATFGQYWVPSWMGTLSIPFVFGPVGGGEDTPSSLLPGLTTAQQCYESLRRVIRFFCRLDPVFRSAIKHAFVISATAETAEKIVPQFRPRFSRIMPQFAMTEKELARFAAFQDKVVPPFRLISMGRLVHWKGYHLAIKAFARLLQDVPDAEYWLVSGGPERARLEALAKESGCGHQLKFYGRLPRLDDVYDKLEQCDVLVHPALHEAFGVACLEALAAGRPVICLNRGGPALQVTPETGIKVEPGTVDETVQRLAEAMLTLARSPDLLQRMKTKARTRAADFLWSRMAEELDEIYHQVCGKLRS